MLCMHAPSLYALLCTPAIRLAPADDPSFSTFSKLPAAVTPTCGSRHACCYSGLWQHRPGCQHRAHSTGGEDGCKAGVSPGTAAA